MERNRSRSRYSMRCSILQPGAERQCGYGSAAGVKREEIVE
jgi:hypothetical protein